MILTATAGTESDVEVKTGYVSVTATSPVTVTADFSATPTSGTAPLTVTFTNLSTFSDEIDGYAWSFGDGATSVLTDPVHVYTQTGNFTVILTATAGTESDSETKVDYITVDALSEPELVTRTITYTYDGLYRLIGADYSTNENFQYIYDAVGNMTALTSTITSTVVTTKTYDAANRLITVTTGGDVRALEWSAAGELLHDGNDTYQWDAAGRLVSATVDGVMRTHRYAYLGDGARISMMVGSATTTYTLDLAAPLVQVLVANENGGSTTYLYGVVRIGEYDDAWRYHLADHLGSVRSLVDGDGEVAGTRAYRPYGSLLSSAGSARSIYGFTGEQVDPTELVYLRARMYTPGIGIFASRDPWQGEMSRPLTLHRYNYALDNPINRSDPSGLFSLQTIYDSLEGQSLVSAFGQRWEDYYSRWGLYKLLRVAKSGESVVGLNFNSLMFGGQYGFLYEDPNGEWEMDCKGGKLVFFNRNRGEKSLRAFLDGWEDRATATALAQDDYWRVSTTRYHWYKHTRQAGADYWYSDFKDVTELPDAIVLSANYLIYGFAEMVDRYGNLYRSRSLGVGRGTSFNFALFEAYASLPSRFYDRVPDDSQLRDIIEGPSFTLQLVYGKHSEGVDIWQSGHMWAYSSRVAGLELSVGFGVTEWVGRNHLLSWDWVERIPGYDSFILPQEFSPPCEGCDYEPNDCECQ